MAHCATCKHAIGYGTYWRAVLRNKRHGPPGRSTWSPVIACPQCRGDNVQEFRSVAVQLVVMVGAGGLALAGAGDWLLADSSRLILVMVPLLAVLDVLWWSFGARLRRC